MRSRAKKANKLRIQQFLVLLLLICFAFFLGSCKNNNAYLKRFSTALDEEKFTTAEQVFREAQRDEKNDFKKEDFVELVKPKIDAVINRYKNEEITYDDAVVKVNAYHLGESFSPHIEGYIKESWQKISQVDQDQIKAESASLYAEAGDYTNALATYKDLLSRDKDNKELKKAYTDTLSNYIKNVTDEVKKLLEDGYPQTAIVNLNAALAEAKDNENLKTLKAEAENAIKSRKKDIQTAVIEFDLDNYLNNGDLRGAEAFLQTLKSKGLEVSDYEVLVDKTKQEYINRALAEADQLAGTLDGRWSENPYAATIARLDQALAEFPNNSALTEKKEYYLARTPDNIADSIYESSGKVDAQATGQDAGGFEHSVDDFNRSIYMRPDSSFKFDVGDYTKVRIVAVPQTDSAGVYNNMQLKISQNGSDLYNKVVFNESTEALIFDYDVEPGSTFQIAIAQSGFASFFDSILGRNGIYFEIFQY